MQKEAVLITGAAGEIGQALVEQLAENGEYTLVTLDLQDLPPELSKSTTQVKGSVADKDLVAALEAKYAFARIYHLAALLSTRAEHAPALAYEVNVGASLLLLELAARQSQLAGRPVQFIFPSSKAIYGIPDLQTKAANPRPGEDEWNQPATMYGCNKLAVEHLGAYYAQRYLQLAEGERTRLDFRALRFPGLISAHTLPTGGTSDYGPEMLHAAAKGEPYACFVRPDTTIAFMAMPDAVAALLRLAAAPAGALKRTAYNVSSFSLSADQFRTQVLKSFPQAQISFAADAKRQAIVDTWPMDIDDRAARRDWGWAPEYDQGRCFEEYLVPNIKKRYGK
ncbi:MAG TPA: NAD-dependent epimerase/dehydratase family protein [Anaerolineales bacterium]|nr:NAD-dependent epimerase/dehydratase family protein [Anaerolineales bacterium]